MRLRLKRLLWMEGSYSTRVRMKHRSDETAVSKLKSGIFETQVSDETG